MSLIIKQKFDFSKKLLCELNVKYIVEIYVTIKLIDDF
jgi:hypothetical protein